MKVIQKLRTKLRMHLTRTHSCNGVRLQHRDRRLNKVMRRLICGNRYEASEIDVLKNLLSPEDRVLELGTCVGYISAYVARQCGSKNVFTVEANPELLSLIRQNYALNEVSPQLIHGVAAVTDGETIPFNICENVCSSGTNAADFSKAVDVPTVDVNRLIQDVRPSFMIIDIEGGEQELVGQLDLDSVQKVLIEVHPHKTGSQAASDVIETLMAKGFCIDFDNTRDISYAMIRPAA